MFNIANNTRNIGAANDAASFSHSELKQFKTGKISFLSLEAQKFKVTWSEENQQFDATPNKSLCSSIYEACCRCHDNTDHQTSLIAADIATAINASEQQDKVSRRAERHDPTAGRLYNLLRDSPNLTGTATLNIIRAGGEEMLTPTGAALPPLSPAANPPRVLLYGLANNRQALVDHIVNNFNLHERAAN